MSDLGNEGLKPSWTSKVVRGLTALGIIGAAGLATEIMDVPNEEQAKAQAALDNPNTPKQNYKVSSDPEIEQAGGLAVRKKPHIEEARGEPPSVINRLPIGAEIKDAIPWTGKSPDMPGQTGKYWVTFKDKEGKPVFVALKYLEPVTKK